MIVSSETVTTKMKIENLDEQLSHGCDQGIN